MNLFRSKKKVGLTLQPSLYLMLFPGFLMILVYHYGPLFGLSLAFMKYDFTMPVTQQEWVGFDNFIYVFKYPFFKRVLWNTFYISFMKLILGMFAPIAVSIMLNEVPKIRVKKALQTMIYLPHFISWVIISGIFIDLLSPSTGAVNSIIKAFGFQPVNFLTDARIFPYVLVVTDIWKSFGFGTIIYLAALTGISPSLYEAAEVDGANRWQKIRHITLPGILPIIVLVGILNLGNILNAGFDQVFNMLNPMVWETGDIIDTLTYRMGIQDIQYDLATAIGLFKSAISLVLVSTSYFLAYKYADYRIF